MNIIHEIITRKPSFIDWNLAEIVYSHCDPCAHGHPIICAIEEFLGGFEYVNLDVVRLLGNSLVVPSYVFPAGYIIGSDPAGFQYALTAPGEIYSIDSDGGDIKMISRSYKLFIESYLFGGESAKFMGTDYANEVLKWRMDIGLIK